ALTGVGCASTTDCIAVGQSDYQSGQSLVGQTLIEEDTALASVIQDMSTSVTYDSWRGVSDLSANGGTYRSSATKGAKATFKFSGTGITWVTRKGPDQGIASVTIDGVKKGNADLYAATVQSFSQGYSGL